MDDAGGDYDYEPRYEDGEDRNFDDFYFSFEGEVPEGETNWPGIERNHPSQTSAHLIPSMINLMAGDFTRQKFVAIGQSIGRNTVLRRLKVDLPEGVYDSAMDDSVYREMTSATSLDAFTAGLSNNRSLRLVSLERYDFVRARLDLLSPLLANNGNLCDLRMANCKLRLEDIRLLGGALGGRSNPVKLLSISKNEINDGLMGGIVEMCNQCPGLKTLCLEECEIGPPLSRHLGTLLANPASMLECLRLDGNPIGDEGALSISGALLCNEKLKKLHLKNCDGISAQGWAKFIDVLLSYDSLHETFDSRNHTLEDIEGAYDTSLHTGDRLDKDRLYDLYFCLFANRDTNKKSAAIRKIARFHMSDDFDIAPFQEANLAVLPRVLEWISYYCTDTEEWVYRSSSHYRVLRNFPELCSFPSREKRIALKLEAEIEYLKKKNKQLTQEIEGLKSNKRQRFEHAVTR